MSRYPAIGFSLLLLTGSMQAVEDKPLPKTLAEAKSWFAEVEDPVFTAPQYPPIIKPSVVDKSKKRLLGGAERMSTRMGLTFQMGGYSPDLRPDEEYRLEPLPNGMTRIVFGEAFWSRFFERTNPETNHHEYASYLLYVLLRAGADEEYLKRYNPERSAWLVQEGAETLSPALRMLKRSVEAPPTSWLAFDGPMYKTSEQFRLKLEPSGNPAKTIQALVRYGLTALSRRAADLYALEEYEKTVGERPTSRMRRRVAERERVQAWEFGRARAAMTKAERMSFKKALETSIKVQRPVLATTAGTPTQ